MRQIWFQMASLHSDKVRFLLPFLQPFPSFATSIFLKYKDEIVRGTVPTFVPFLFLVAPNLFLHQHVLALDPQEFFVSILVPPLRLPGETLTS